MLWDVAMFAIFIAWGLAVFTIAKFIAWGLTVIRIRHSSAPVETHTSRRLSDDPLQIAEAQETEGGALEPTSATPAMWQFNIGTFMVVVVAFAIVFAIVPNGVAAVVVSSMLSFFYVVFRHVAPGDPLPGRVGRRPLESWTKWRVRRAARTASSKAPFAEL
jgi:hypothetical protein